ncbi:MAG: sulfurtransferase, partial [Endozoicomonas sp.]
RWAGLKHVMVLHGGMKAWLARFYPVSTDTAKPTISENNLTTGHMPIATADDLNNQISGSGLLHKLIDARALTRFRGEEESMDSVAGHIPGAVCHPFTDNLDDDGRFYTPEYLNQIFSCLIEEDVQPICYCGSGVTACHNILAMEYAGIKGTVLYPGSWSEWITDPQRPVAKGS